MRTSGIWQPSGWASVVSDHALVLRDWLLGLGFTEDLMIPGEQEGLVITANWIGLRAVACCCPALVNAGRPVGQAPARCTSSPLTLTLWCSER